jgi:hypothetical protein
LQPIDLAGQVVFVAPLIITDADVHVAPRKNAARFGLEQREGWVVLHTQQAEKQGPKQRRHKHPIFCRVGLLKDPPEFAYVPSQGKFKAIKTNSGGSSEPFRGARTLGVRTGGAPPQLLLPRLSGRKRVLLQFLLRGSRRIHLSHGYNKRKSRAAVSTLHALRRCRLASTINKNRYFSKTRSLFEKVFEN